MSKIDIDAVVRQYKANRDRALQHAVATRQLDLTGLTHVSSVGDDDFSVGANGYNVQRSHRMVPKGNKSSVGKRMQRGTVHWKTRMAEGPVGRRRGPVGQSPSAETEGNCPIDEAATMPTGMGCEDVPPCGVNVIGGNTLGTTGIVPAATAPVVITAGDAGYFQPRAIYFEAFPFSSEDLIDPAALPAACCVLPVIMVDAAIGRVSVLRRGGSPDRGLTQGGFANTKELVAVDWGEFVSTNEQNLTLFFYNPNDSLTIHVFVDLWGNI